MKKYIAYYRVSTKQQGDSGLGLGAQKDAVERFIQNQQDRTSTLSNREGARISLLAEFQEVESGTNDFRPKIIEAIRMCNKLSAKGDDVILLIAKLDRLSRSIQFISTLQNGGVKFTCCDMPDANNLTINMMAVIAQNEAEMIAIRTKDALAIKVKSNPNGWLDKHGVIRTRLGNPENLTREASIKGALANKRKAETNPDNIRAMNYSQTLRDIGMTYANIATKLNLEGFRTSNGADFMPSQIKRLLDRKNNQNVTVGY